MRRSFFMQYIWIWELKKKRCVLHWFLLFHLYSKYPRKLVHKEQIEVFLSFWNYSSYFIFLVILIKCYILNFDLIKFQIFCSLPFNRRYQIKVQGTKHFYHYVILRSILKYNLMSNIFKMCILFYSLDSGLWITLV